MLGAIYILFSLLDNRRPAPAKIAGSRPLTRSR